MTGRPAGSAVPAGLPDYARGRLETLAREHPQWHSWLALVEGALREAREPGWELAVPEAQGEGPPGAPLLAGAVLVVAPSLASRWVRWLLERATGGSGAGGASLAAAARAGRLDALALLEAAVCQDEGRFGALAAGTGADPRALAAVGQLAAMPLLQACGRHLAGRVPAGWRQGYCPICGAWPALAELRGLESARRLRCGRCGADWGVEWLRCPYCGVTDHRPLGSLVPEEHGDSRKVDVCAACRGYLKTVTTLRPWPSYGVPLEDLATVELDIVARGRGYTRPEAPGFALGARVVGPAAPEHDASTVER